MHYRKKKGKEGERIAKEYFKNLGYKILHAPWERLPYGEIDLVAQDGKGLVFIEVKARADQEFGYPEEAVDAQKLWKLRTLIEMYLQENRIIDAPYRLDVIAVEFEHHPPKITHIKAVGLDPIHHNGE